MPNCFPVMNWRSQVSEVEVAGRGVGVNAVQAAASLNGIYFRDSSSTCTCIVLLPRTFHVNRDQRLETRLQCFQENSNTARSLPASSTEVLLHFSESLGGALILFSLPSFLPSLPCPTSRLPRRSKENPILDSSN